MKSRCGFIKDIDGLSRITFAQFRGKLYALAFSARERGTGLTQLYITQTYILQHLYLVQDIGLVLEELHSLVDGHVQHIRNALAAEPHLQRFSFVALSVTFLTRYIHIGQEVHLNGLVSVTGAGLAASAFHVEGKASWLVAAYLGFGQFHKEVSDVVEYACISGGIASRRPAKGRLVHVHHLVHVLQPLNGFIVQRILQRTVGVLTKYGMERIVHKRTLSASAHSGHTNEFSERKLHIASLQIVASCAL